jgi:hypothetical protein
MQGHKHRSMGGKPVETIARAARAAALDLQPLRGARRAPARPQSVPRQWRAIPPRAQPEQLAAAVVPGFLSGDGADHRCESFEDIQGLSGETQQHWRKINTLIAKSTKQDSEHVQDKRPARSNGMSRLSFLFIVCATLSAGTGSAHPELARIKSPSCDR